MEIYLHFVIELSNLYKSIADSYCVPLSLGLRCDKYVKGIAKFDAIGQGQLSRPK